MLYNIIVTEPFTLFCVTHDYVTITVTYMTAYDIMLYSNPKFKI